MGISGSKSDVNPKNAVWTPLEKAHPELGETYWLWWRDAKQPVMSTWIRNYMGEGWALNLYNPTVEPIRPEYIMIINKPSPPNE